MSQIEEVKRIVPGAELFFSESVAQYLADLSEEAYYEEAECEGLLLGRIYHDDHGNYTVVSGVSHDFADLSNAVGIYRSKMDTCSAAEGDIHKAVSLFGTCTACLIILDASHEEMAMYSVSNCVCRKVRSAMLESM